MKGESKEMYMPMEVQSKIEHVEKKLTKDFDNKLKIKVHDSFNEVIQFYKDTDKSCMDRTSKLS